jgi:hypothetical protein
VQDSAVVDLGMVQDWRFSRYLRYLRLRDHEMHLRCSAVADGRHSESESPRRLEPAVAMNAKSHCWPLQRRFGALRNGAAIDRFLTPRVLVADLYRGHPKGNSAGTLEVHPNG